VGGGGYDRTVVPRAWTLAWGIMSNQRFPNELPAEIASDYDPALLHDELEFELTSEQQQQARQAAEAVVESLSQSLVF
jgi:hypothetical protein